MMELESIILTGGSVMGDKSPKNNTKAKKQKSAKDDKKAKAATPPATSGKG
jgi:hypothetical protein